MNVLNLSENIVRLRRERKITQEELADFAGVTKASVSKWESGKSTPDIMLLPLLASFFDVTVDELMGYEPQLSKEQIRKIYSELSTDFAKLPFSEALAHAREYAQRYYSCYQFLLQLGILYLNHFMLAGQKEEGIWMLQEAESYCEHILARCKDVSVKQDATSLKAMIYLQQGKVKDAIEILESLADPTRFSGQDDLMMVQAYIQSGDKECANSYAQVRVYLHLLSLISLETMLLPLNQHDPKRCETTIKHAGSLIEIYDLKNLHPNVAAQFYYQAAVFYEVDGNKKDAVTYLENFGQCVMALLSGDRPILAGDEYFNHLDEWIESTTLGDMAPRDRSFIIQSSLQVLSDPVFDGLRDTKEFQKICDQIAKGGK